jgi:hypothetical protein
MQSVILKKISGKNGYKLLIRKKNKLTQVLNHFNIYFFEDEHENTIYYFIAYFFRKFIRS